MQKVTWAPSRTPYHLGRVLAYEHSDDEDSYGLDVQGESCLGCPDDSQPMGWMLG